MTRYKSASSIIYSIKIIHDEFVCKFAFPMKSLILLASSIFSHGIFKMLFWWLFW